MTFTIESRSELGELRSDVEELLSRTADADGIEPFDEQARLNMAKSVGSRYLLAFSEGEGASYRDDEPGGEGASRERTLVGIAAVDVRARSVELTVDPDFRELGIGTQLLQRVLDEAGRADGGGRLTIWAHGSSAGSEALAQRYKLEKVRELLVMTRNLVTLDKNSATDTDEWSIEPFEEERDLDDLVVLNSAAFADHPEQGKLTEEDFRERFAQSWFDPSMLWLVRERGNGTDVVGNPVAFLWLKPHSTTQVELYVLGVDPSAQGQGLGGMLSAFMLHEMIGRHFTEAILYVESDNEPAVRAYHRVGFEVSERHVAYGLPVADSGRD